MELITFLLSIRRYESSNLVAGYAPDILKVPESVNQSTYLPTYLPIMFIHCSPTKKFIKWFTKKIKKIMSNG